MKKNIIIGVTSIVLAFGAIIGLAKVCAPKSDVSQEAATTQTKAKTKKINKIGYIFNVVIYILDIYAITLLRCYSGLNFLIYLYYRSKIYIIQKIRKGD